MTAFILLTWVIVLVLAVVAGNIIAHEGW